MRGRAWPVESTKIAGRAWRVRSKATPRGDTGRPAARSVGDVWRGLTRCRIPVVVLGTSRLYMMYMVRGNRGGAETDGRAEDPFEAAARGASASAPWKLLFFFYLTLYPFLSPCLPSSLPSRASLLLDRASLLRLRNQAQKRSRRAPSILALAPLSNTV